MQKSDSPLIGLVMGSSSDWEVMRHAASVIEDFNISYEKRVISAHRMPKEMFEYATLASERGLKGIIAGAGGAAHLPGMLASLTELPVFGVPVPSKYLSGEDSLLSIVQMPKGIPVATFAIGEAGATNAALHLIANLAIYDSQLCNKLRQFRKNQNHLACSMTLPPI
ncbi:5-(carboxyamino)imidazole ribonucleotide mutase [Candidatus Kinetoplastibacterium desouzaii TCC079E]|uniref:N5-carboxyaminoimidazole ribonucleotide mutase n=1 Tax=Candidatus Kinetoplastidibacterium desouzai TCC079E TaxID=1208919 RepID=M1LLR3_9PROT|nr:5-(carboxyamino)imidazole ribonucleotide mutase [Candidatus Kinetoplastibacterium desouzaii]AGF46687.1 5-(carboxyamino)imidazole ribonucleotide mutase [Candidatus Kinetoplastibacterium desouzaii TCC079E]